MPNLISTPTRVRRSIWLGVWCFLVSLLPLQVHAAAPVSEPHQGGWRLSDQSSPYLRMHRDNPVEWYPWGPEALARARAENKPLFISIGYFTCHWCHVMERESFRNPDIAKLLNTQFISIKIDREQRPDLDAAYMSFVVATRGFGGWPMTVLATPDGTPFFGGTYLPPEDRDSFPGLAPLLRKAGTLWRQDQKGIIQASREAVTQITQATNTGAPLTRLTQNTLEQARQQFQTEFDVHEGGFGLAPKFPKPTELLFLLQDDAPRSAEMALFTLDRMAEGGIYDHLEGGFHRYTTDAAWRVPHFEKMLYDQALLVRAYLAAYRRTHKPQYADVARKTLDFVLTHLRDPRGGFYSALSADSATKVNGTTHMQEGAYYVWDWKQLLQAIPDEALRRWAIARYGLKKEGNVAHSAPAELSGQNVLFVAKNDRELTNEFKESNATVRERVQAANSALLVARGKRPMPPRDDKIVTAWNGYLITALADAARDLKQPRYLQAAQQATRFILEELFDNKKRVLYRDWRDGRRGSTGFSEDYAAMTEALLVLAGDDRSSEWAQSARLLTDAQIAYFWDGSVGGFYSSDQDNGFWVRHKTALDNVTPSSSALAVGNLLVLAKLTGEREYAAKAVRTAAWQGGLLRENPVSMSYTLMRWPDLIDTSR